MSELNVEPIRVLIDNSAGWIIQTSGGSASSGTGVIILNSGGLFSMQSGAWAVSSTILNSAGWIVAVSNTGGSVTITNSSALVYKPSAVNITTVASTIGLVTLLTNNANRIFGTFYNDSLTPLYLKLGASASTASFTLKITSSGYYELPQPVYTGIITALWNSANGICYISEAT